MDERTQPFPVSVKHAAALLQYIIEAWHSLSLPHRLGHSAPLWHNVLRPQPLGRIDLEGDSHGQGWTQAPRSQEEWREPR